MTDENLLRVQNLTKSFPVARGFWGRENTRVHAVSNVSFSLKKGKTLGLVGESGCGKSTLGRTLLRLIEPDSGQVFFNHVEITKLSQSQLRPLRRQFQIIFQDPFASLDPRFSVREILAEPFEIHNVFKKKAEKEQRIQELLNEVGLGSDALERYPHEFSGGQRQRLGIARALALHPRLIVCDEPVSALDVSVQSQILNLMMDLRDKHGLSYIFIAHDLSVVEHISDEIAVMYMGQIVEQASSQNLYRTPLHPYTTALIQSIPRRDKVGKRERTVITGDVPNPMFPPSGCRFHTRCPYAKDICRIEAPSLFDHGRQGETHLVSCHFPRSNGNSHTIS